jgi:hypothetical protein
LVLKAEIAFRGEGKMNWNSMSREDHMGSHYSDNGYYSISLLAFIIKRQKWLAEEYENGRITEKQFLEALVIETSNHLLSNDEDKDAT